MPNWYSPEHPTAVVQDITTHESLPVLDPQYLTSQYFLGLTQDSYGDLAVRDGEMSLRIETSNQMVLTQAGMFMPLEAPDDAFATWQLRWPYLSEGEIRRLQLATETGLFTINDPILASCTGYISNLAFEVLPGYTTPEGHNMYSATVEFAVVRIEWPAILAVPADGSYGADSGFGAYFNGVFPLRTPTGIDVMDGWFECFANPHEHLVIVGQNFQQQAGTFVAVVQHYGDSDWRIGAASTPARTLFSAYPQDTATGMAIYFENGNLIAENLVPTGDTFTLDVSELADMPIDSHFLVAVGYHRSNASGSSGNPTELYQVAMGVTAWHPTGTPKVVFGNFGKSGATLTTTGFTEGWVNVGGSRLPVATATNTSLYAKVRPVNNRFFFNSPPTRGLMASLMGSYLQRYELAFTGGG